MSVVKVEMQMTSTGAADFSVGRGRVFKTLLLSQISPTSPPSDRDARQQQEKSGANKRELLFCKQILLSFVLCELSRRGAWSGVVARVRSA